MVLLQNYSVEEGAIIYGLAQQAHYGDVQGEQPNAVNVEAYLMWGWWNDQRGKSKEQAIREWLEYTLPIIQREGMTIEHPDESLVQKKYKQCVDKQLELGVTLAEIEEQRQKYVRDQEIKSQR